MYCIHTEVYGFARFFTPLPSLHLSSACFHPLLCSSAYGPLFTDPWSLGLAAALSPCSTAADQAAAVDGCLSKVTNVCDCHLVLILDCF